VYDRHREKNRGVLREGAGGAELGRLKKKKGAGLPVLGISRTEIGPEEGAGETSGFFGRHCRTSPAGNNLKK